MATTLSNLRTYFYNTVAEPITSGANDVYPPDFVDELLNQGQYDACVNGKHNLRFLVTKYHFVALQWTTITTNVAAGATSITVGLTTNYPSSGAVLLGEELITYTGKTATTLTGIPASGNGSIAVAHVSGEEVRPAYSLPSNFHWVKQLRVGEAKIYPINDSQFQRESKFVRDGYFIDQIHGTNYLFLPSFSNAELSVLEYFKIPSTMTVSVDATIPDIWAKRVIVPFAVWKAFLHRYEDQRALAFKDIYEKEKALMVQDQISFNKPLNYIFEPRYRAGRRSYKK